MDFNLISARLAKYAKLMPSGCVEWIGSKNRRGYGQLRYMGSPRLAHRLSYIVATEASLDSISGKMVCHHCDNPACINPNHLFLGTGKDNVQDMCRKDRHSGRLTAQDVAEIRASDASRATLAERFGVAVTTISAARSGATFRHIGGASRRGAPKGSRHRWAKLTEKDAAFIRASDATAAALATQFSVHVQTIYRVRRGANWTHVTEEFGAPTP